MTTPTRACLVLGGSGLVGTQLLALLSVDDRWTEVRAFTRRPLPVSLPRVRAIPIDYADPASYRDHVGVDDVFCCLGTTIKVAGSQDAFRKVDFEAPVAVARARRDAGAGRYLVVTAVGADPSSAIFYNRVKGETEAALRELAFPRGLSIFHPSLLLGERGTPRAGERVASVLMRATRPLFAGPLLRYRAIDAADVARAMVAASRQDAPGVQVYEGPSLFALLG
jgi:uncharacterized protein YbjT (DUF2867 family)